MDNILFFHPQNDFSGSTRVLANVIETEYIGRKISVITLNRSEGFLSMLSYRHQENRKKYQFLSW